MSKEPRLVNFKSIDAYQAAWNDWKTNKDYYSGLTTDQHTPGAKLDDDKVDMSLLEFLPRAIREVCRVMTYGQVKYTRGGFLEVPDAVNRYSAAMLRHYFAGKEEGLYDQDPFYNTDIGAPFKGKILHDAQVAVNALFRLECYLREYQEEQHTIERFEDIANNIRVIEKDE